MIGCGGWIPKDLPWTQPCWYFVQFFLRCIKIVLYEGLAHESYIIINESTNLQQLVAFVSQGQSFHFWQMTKQEFVDLFQNCERRALHPLIRQIVPALFDPEEQKACFRSVCPEDGKRAGT